MDDWPKDHKQLGAQLGYREDTIRGRYRVLKQSGALIEGTDYRTEPWPSNGRPRCFWTEAGAIKVAQERPHSRKAQDFLASRGGPPPVRSRAECDTIEVIIAALDGITKCSPQHPVRVNDPRYRPYKVDLYLPELRLAIECDENGHPSYESEDEAVRQFAIEQYLPCTFLRYDPYTPTFNVGTVINDILKIYLDAQRRMP